MVQLGAAHAAPPLERDAQVLVYGGLSCSTYYDKPWREKATLGYFPQSETDVNWAHIQFDLPVEQLIELPSDLCEREGFGYLT